MKKIFILGSLLFFVICVQAQNTVPNNTTVLELAKATLKAHGGEKLNQAKNMVLKGTADVTAPGSNQTLPVGFVIIVAGEKYRFELQSAFISFKQVSDGVNTSSSVAGISLPPMNRVGLFVLPKIEESGFVVSTLPEKFKKKKGFRVTSPEGYYTDFVIDEKTSLVKEYESSYMLGERTVSTSIAIDKYRDIDGVLVNEKFSQRLDIGPISSYAYFTAKEIMVNSEVSDALFSIN